MSTSSHMFAAVAICLVVGVIGCGTKNNSPSNNTTSNNTTSNNTTANNTTSNNTTSNNTTPRDGTFCRLECATAADCGDAAQFDCTNNRCVYNGARCAVDDDCVAVSSGWVMQCQSDADCQGLVCVDTGDATAGRCANDATGPVSCELLMQSEFATTKFDDASAVTVCAITGAKCEDQTCFVPCTEDGDCFGLTCDVSSGHCVCENDAQCPGNGADKCYDGACGCAAEASCDALEIQDRSYFCE